MDDNPYLTLLIDTQITDKHIGIHVESQVMYMNQHKFSISSYITLYEMLKSTQEISRNSYIGSHQFEGAYLICRKL